MSWNEKPKVIPPVAEREILGRLYFETKLSVDDLVEILRRHGVVKDPEALLISYLKEVGQRYMASLRDNEGNRMVYCIKNRWGEKEYIILDFCNDRRKFRQVQENLSRSLTGMDCSLDAVDERRERLNRVDRQFRPHGGMEERRR